ncbi:FepC ABC-type cobalamin/Fe3+-siderophores transport systems, ATPase components [Candidatus Nanopelagicaceae bacterium]|jgi:ABC-type cobalamin/Fe3+-siderophores transport system ATPase subunit
MIEIKNLSVARGKRTIVDNFSATIAPGSITAITGPNGCGKSTLAQAISGDLKYQSGQITIAGRELQTITLEEQAELRSVVEQNRNYWLSFTAREVISMGQSEADLARMDGVMQRLHITEYADQPVTTLSGGQAQRVELARALIRDTPIYIFDEPLSAQDSQSKARIIEEFQALQRAGKTIIVIAHIDRQALTWCDQIIDFT